jgi:hypothetical protein
MEITESHGTKTFLSVLSVSAVVKNSDYFFPALVYFVCFVV